VDYQISQTRDHLQVVVASNIATLVGGDFNVVAYSDSLNRIYNSAILYGYGQFGEVDQYCGGSNRTKPLGRGCGSYTNGVGKIDFTFDNGNWANPSAVVTGGWGSDHELLHGAIQLTP